MYRLLFHPLMPLLIFAAALTALMSTYLFAGLAPSERFETVAAFFWCLLLAIWIVADARRRTGVPCFDFGFFCYVFFPLVVPWYCFWSRGWRGVLLLVTLAALWLAPYIISGIVWTALYG